MNDLRLYELLKKQQKNKLSPEEERLLNDWFDGLDNTPGQDLPLSSMKSRIWSAISLRVNARLRTGNDEQMKEIPRYRQIGYRATAAAVIVVLACSAWYFLLPHKRTSSSTRPPIAMTTVRAPHGGSPTKVILPDGTTVWLNGDAILEYPVSFDTTRDVYLQYGEAFFDVTANAAQPFIVHSQQLHTQVLGTSFDIRNTPDRYMVAVASGKVKVYYGSREKSINVAHMLGAGERLITDSIGSGSVIDSLDKNLCKGWTDKAYHLKDVSLSGIVFCMESIYGVTIKIRNEELKKLTFTTRVTSKDRMLDILGRLSLAGDFHYKIDSQDSVTIY